MNVAGQPLEPTTPSGAGRSVDARDRAAAPAGRDADGGERAFPGERVTVSGAARAASSGAGSPARSGAHAATGAGAAPGAAGGASGEASAATEGARSGGPGSAWGREGVPGARRADPLDAREQAVVAQLQARDAHVRAHEAAHQAAGGGLTGGASYTYQLGPDGKAYAVGGEVPVRSGGGTTADARIADAQRVRAAALAPADPSPQDLAVATAALQSELTARADKAKAATRAYAKVASRWSGPGSRDRTEAKPANAAPGATPSAATAAVSA